MLDKLKHTLRVAHAVIREKTKALKRSPKWSGVRKKHLKDQPLCMACGGKKLLQVHHKQPFHIKPELELDPSNLITLCVWASHDCHLNFGHGGDWDAYNPEVEHDTTEALLASAQVKEGRITKGDLRTFLAGITLRAKHNRKYSRGPG